MKRRIRSVVAHALGQTVAAIGLLAVLAGPAAAANEGRLSPEAVVLDNGLTLVVVSNPQMPAVAHYVFYKVGSIDEPWGKSGIAHFLEHLMFKGTPTVPDATFSRVIASNGGRDNAFTSYDFTGYYQMLPADKLPLAMEMEADRMANLAFTEAQVESERRVVLEERFSRTDNSPSAQLREQTRAALYLNHPYRLPVIGWEQEIRQLGHADARAFYERWYAPNNAIVVVGGRVTMAEARPMAERTYGRIAARPLPPRTVVQEPARVAETRIEMASERVRQPYVNLAYIAPSLFTGDTRHAYPLEVLATIMGSGVSSRLNRALVLEGSLAVSASTSYDSNQRGPATFNIFATPRQDVPVAAVEAAMAAEVARILKDGVTEAELARAIRRVQDSAVYARDSLSGPARIVGSALAIGLPLEEVDAWPERVGAVTAAEIAAAARHVFRSENLATSILLPKRAQGS
ncbi:zinc protease [Stella humosa]|uniref:Zinc protease n=1 Tax=Stella humosa TaxID=94 RepID=A0A3N1LIN0_9PROT|nr:pitrilysin family protein [Stella humosa]ROP91014.1 zinc protease [Stella humosa]BBK34636.1 peptidase M16 [Stella humosa]